MSTYEINKLTERGFILDTDEKYQEFAKGGSYSTSSDVYSTIYSPNLTPMPEVYTPNTVNTVNRYASNHSSNIYLQDIPIDKRDTKVNLLGLKNSYWGTNLDTYTLGPKFTGAGIVNLVPEAWGNLPGLRGVGELFNFNSIYSYNSLIEKINFFWQDGSCWSKAQVSSGSNSYQGSSKKICDGPGIFVIMSGPGGGGQGGSALYAGAPGRGGQSGASIFTYIDLQFLTLKFRALLKSKGKEESEIQKAIETNTLVFTTGKGGTGGNGNTNTTTTSEPGDAGNPGSPGSASSKLTLDWATYTSSSDPCSFTLECCPGSGGKSDIPKDSYDTHGWGEITTPKEYKNEAAVKFSYKVGTDSYTTPKSLLSKWLVEEKKGKTTSDETYTLEMKEYFYKVNTRLANFGIFLYSAFLGSYGDVGHINSLYSISWDNNLTNENRTTLNNFLTTGYIKDETAHRFNTYIADNNYLTPFFYDYSQAVSTRGSYEDINDSQLGYGPTYRAVRTLNNNLEAYSSYNFGGAGGSAPLSFSGLLDRTGDMLKNYCYKSYNKDCYITFSSTSDFTLKTDPIEKSWNGKLEYSTDGINWTEWVGTDQLSSANNKLYLRGTGNTYISNRGNTSWMLTGTEEGQDISCIGNIETLLDYQAVASGGHPAMADNCFNCLFYECKSLVNAPDLPATNLTTDCYTYMFYECKKLVKAPDLPATNLAIGCYDGMFYGCTSLVKAPELPATTLATNCYKSMFNGCISLTKAPDLPAINLANFSCEAMFSGCTSLKVAPELPATTLAEYCYKSMFSGCTSLIIAPELPATTLASRCYESMFQGCTSLITLPTLPALYFPYNCCQKMFKGCTSIKVSTTQSTEYPNEYRIPIKGKGINQGAALLNMFDSIEGQETGGTPKINTTYYYGINEEEEPKGKYYITFSSPLSFTLKTDNGSKNWNGTLEYSTDGTNWYTWSGTKISSVNNKLYLRGTGNHYLTTNSSGSTSEWDLDGTDISCTGNIETLLDYQIVADGSHPTMANNCFSHLFYNCTNLVKAPELPATTLTEGCYKGMFSGCIKLAEVPSLPATTLAKECYSCMFWKCTSLTKTPELPAVYLADSCYDRMFYRCTSLKVAPKLSATILADYCYSGMFIDCGNLTTLPELPATTLAKGCYQQMFGWGEDYQYSGIRISTTQSTEYPNEYRIPISGEGTTAAYALQNMFSYIEGKETEPKTPEINTTYFTNCTVGSVKNGYITLTFSSPMTNFTLKTDNGKKNWNGKLQYSTDTEHWTEWEGTNLYLTGYNKLYLRGIGNTYISKSNSTKWTVDTDSESISCTGNIETLLDFQKVLDGDHPDMNDNCFSCLFSQWNKLIEAPELLATTLTYSCYSNMFAYCRGLKVAPELPATNLAGGCYQSMFRYCKSLVKAPELPATSLKSYCYTQMFCGCESLVDAPKLPATTITTQCYLQMFKDCTSLVNAPELSAITLNPGCYKGMFSGCTALITTPDLPATTLDGECYTSMFQGCTNLVKAPDLPATTLATNCYNSMFMGCTSLTEISDLPATILATNCYQYMFKNCTNLIDLPKISGTSFTTACCQEMFYGCNNIKLSTTQSATCLYPYRIPIKGIGTELPSSNALKDMFSSIEGQTSGTPLLNTTYFTNCIIEKANSCLTFSSPSSFSLRTSNGKKNWNGTLEYSTDGINWTEWNGINYLSSVNNKLYLRGTGNTYISQTDNTAWLLLGSYISCTGKIETLLDYQTVLNEEHPDMASNCFSYLFSNCTNLVKAPNLSATTLTEGCYKYIFGGCTSLVNAPELPATNLAEYCYKSMFSGCTSLIIAPELPATTLANSCYSYMFNGCTSLKVAPKLPAINLASYCYNYMFNGCTSLINAPELLSKFLIDGCYFNMFNSCTSLVVAPDLPAIYLAENCYSGMFAYCTSLKVAPELPATTLADSCYSSMFEDCTSLTIIPELSATTLAPSCYSSMFYGCTSLITLPELPAINLLSYCYNSMFYGCTSIKLSTTQSAEYSTEYRIPSSGTGTDLSGESKTALASMFSSIDGKTSWTPEINKTYFTNSSIVFNNKYTTYIDKKGFGYSYGGAGAPSGTKASLQGFAGLPGGDGALAVIGWAAREKRNISNGFITLRTKIQLLHNSILLKTANGKKNWNGELEYSIDAVNWYTWSGEDVLYFKQNTLYLRGTGNTYISTKEASRWVLTGENISCIGNIETLLDYQTVLNGGHPGMASNCFSYLFSNCTNLVKAPDLPATTLTYGCYQSMFRGCKSLVNAPKLPATTLAEYCYNYMFNGCTSLITLPKLPATTLTDYCYNSMFEGCTKIKLLSATQPTEEYPNEYRIPISGEGTTAAYALGGMFSGTGGTFTGTPSINTMYYTSNEIV